METGVKLLQKYIPKRPMDLQGTRGEGGTNLAQNWLAVSRRGKADQLYNSQCPEDGISQWSSDKRNCH